MRDALPLESDYIHAEARSLYRHLPCGLSPSSGPVEKSSRRPKTTPRVITGRDDGGRDESASETIGRHSVPGCRAR